MKITHDHLMAARRICSVRVLSLKPAEPRAAAEGILLRCELELDQKIGVRADLRRRKDAGSPYLAFPRGRSRTGRWHSHLWPVSPEVQAAIELQVVHAARSMGLLDESATPDAA
jgi:hypothetical protein